MIGALFQQDGVLEQSRSACADPRSSKPSLVHLTVIRNLLVNPIVLINAAAGTGVYDHGDGVIFPPGMPKNVKTLSGPQWRGVARHAKNRRAQAQLQVRWSEAIAGNEANALFATAG
jgi:hypothetical protein